MQLHTNEDFHLLEGFVMISLEMIVVYIYKQKNNEF